MSLAERIESYSRFKAARAFAPSETLRNYDSNPLKTEVGSTSAVRDAPGLFAQVADWAFQIDAREVPNEIGRITTQTFYIVGGVDDSDESPATQELRSRLDQTSGSHHDEESGWRSDLQEVLRRARQHVSIEISARLESLARLTVEEGDIPLQVEAAGWFVDYCIRRGVRRRPLMTITPMGELDATWRGGDAETVVIRFFARDHVWVAFRFTSAKGSFESTVSKLASKECPFRFPDWANA